MKKDPDIKAVEYGNRKKERELYLTQGCFDVWLTCHMRGFTKHAEESWKAMQSAAIREWGEGTCCTLNLERGVVEIEHLDGRKAEFVLL